MLLFSYTLAIRLTRYNGCPRDYVRLFVSTGIIIKSSNVTAVDDYK